LRGLNDKEPKFYLGENRSIHTVEGNRKLNVFVGENGEIKYGLGSSALVNN